VDLAEKLLALLDDEAARRRMGHIGRERVQAKLAWEHEAPRLLAAYEALFAGYQQMPR
jgi:glycosyltransferase involved in cell wall biosynthesis